MTKEEKLQKQIERLAEMREYEDALRSEGSKTIAGMDEVGRGPLAGPVYAACVVLPDDFDVPGIDDSKKLTEKKRMELDAVIREKAIAYGIGVADNREIDSINILNATKLAMQRAYKACDDELKRNASINGSSQDKIDVLLIDALTVEEIDIRQEAIVKGDSKILSIAAASIVAKVARDAYMKEMDEQYPGYGFADNKGYGTAAHYDGIRDLGVTPIHRITFLKNFEDKHSGAADRKVDMDRVVGDRKRTTAKRSTGKLYAVKEGRKTGIFESWDECKEQINGYKGAEYKSFGNIDDAKEYLGETSGTSKAEIPRDGEAFAYVDGSYDSARNRYSCGALILTKDGEHELSESFWDVNSAELRNVAGEIMGARRAIEYAIEHGFDFVRVYHDYAGIGKWGDDEWKANLDMTKEYKSFVKSARDKIRIEFVKVKGHSGNKYNDRADELARSALM